MQGRVLGILSSRAAATLAVLAALASRAEAAPDLAFRSRVVLDPPALGGDNDHRPEPGESFDILLTLVNEGDEEARNITGRLSSTSPGLVVAPLPATVSFPNLMAAALGESQGTPFRLSAVSVGCGEPVALELDLSYSDPLGAPITDRLRFLLFVGEETVHAREDFDSGPGGWDQDDLSSSPPQPPNRNGRWVNAAPQGYTWSGQTAQPERDASWPDVSCMYTGQNLTPGDPSNQNVDGGSQVLLSRTYDWSGLTNLYVSYARFFFSDDAGAQDRFVVEVSGNGGASWLPLESRSTSENRWTWVAYRLDTQLALGPNMRLRAVATDAGLASVCEAALDDLWVRSFECKADPQTARLDSADPVVDDTADPLCSDADSLPDAGESFDFSVLVTNAGTATARNTRAMLVTPLPAELTLLGSAVQALGDLADNGGSARASFRLRVVDPVACQLPVALEVEIVADPPYVAQRRSYPLTLEQDVNQPRLVWRDDFDSGLAPWSVVNYGGNSVWNLSVEDCIRNPGTPPTPARNFWYTGNTGIPGDCSANPYGPLVDSAIRTPRIDTGVAAPQLLELRWNQLLTLTPNDPDVAEVWIDHDDDGVFDRLASYQGQVTTNGDTLDPASIDLQALVGATRHVQLELRFRSDVTGGGGNPTALGWIVDNVELSFTDANGRQCDQHVCAGCAAAAMIAPAPSSTCAGVPLDLDASASAVANCPAPGAIAYQWLRDFVPLPGATAATYRVLEPGPGQFRYQVEVRCSTDPSCADSATHLLDVEPDGLPLGVGNTLRARKTGPDVELFWTDPQPLAVAFHLYRASAKGAPGASLRILAQSYLDQGALAPPPIRRFYGVRALSCSGLEGP